MESQILIIRIYEIIEIQLRQSVENAAKCALITFDTIRLLG